MNAPDRAIVRWIAENVDNAGYDRRVLLIPQQRDLKYASATIQSFGATGNVGSSRSPHVNRGGPVLAYRPDVRQLGRAVAAAEGQVLGVIEFAEGRLLGGQPRRTPLTSRRASQPRACPTRSTGH
jgi:hypothetical protein